MPLRAAAGVVAAGAVVLTATGGTLVGPAKQEAATSAQEDLTAQRVAQVWRSAGSSGAAGAEQQAAAAPPEAAALQAELVSERGSAASRSEDRLSADQPSAPPGQPADQPGDQPGDQPAGAPADPADPVARAQQQVQELLSQADADAADASLAAAASQRSAAQARDAVAAAQAQRAAERAAAELAAAQADPRSVARPLAAERGWGAEQFSCLDRLWTKESGWKWSADNPTSSAYGIPQALPGAKMASHGEGWESDPRVQIAWGLDYIASSYGAPCRAWAHSQAVNWY
ncbi:phospholipase [Streptomyces sp. NP160]|uniref:aggregation-promoting factor C-terminal-like domain-containing protein n=1 Tax=Streptomyces sp. NP160 TaxID=2586637 RepID=UPI00111B1A0A|nr:phospholipase [Streptomyces sp. NP160]TNM67471.1 phospholipase [Streptomyces sp. NP160]